MYIATDGIKMIENDAGDQKFVVDSIQGKRLRKSITLATYRKSTLSDFITLDEEKIRQQFRLSNEQQEILEMVYISYTKSHYHKYHTGVGFLVTITNDKYEIYKFYNYSCSNKLEFEHQYNFNRQFRPTKRAGVFIEIKGNDLSKLCNDILSGVLTSKQTNYDRVKEVTYYVYKNRPDINRKRARYIRNIEPALHNNINIVNYYYNMVPEMDKGIFEECFEFVTGISFEKFLHQCIDKISKEE